MTEFLIIPIVLAFSINNFQGPLENTFNYRKWNKSMKAAVNSGGNRSIWKAEGRARSQEA